MSSRYRVVDDYYRREHFEFWRRYRHPFYALTFHLEITALKTFTDARGYPLYLNLCYYMTRAMRGIEDFRYRLLDGRIVLYEELHPGLTLPAPEGRFTFGYFAYHPEVEVFNARAQKISDGARRAVDLTESEHRNWAYFTAVPKVAFTGFTHATNEPTDGEPQIAFGRYAEEDGRLTVPVGLQVNHIFIDGNAVGELVERTQRGYDNPE